MKELGERRRLTVSKSTTVKEIKVMVSYSTNPETFMYLKHASVTGRNEYSDYLPKIISSRARTGG
jgi:hypothetical protein